MKLRRHPPEAAPAPDRVVVTGYHLTAIAGIGRLGPVYRAVQQARRREVALRLLRPGGTAPGRGLAERFLRHAQAARDLQHEHLIAALDAGADGDAVWQAIEPFAGQRLADLVDGRAALPTKVALRIALDCARALEAIHRAGAAHLHLRPGNVVITADGAAVVADAGMSPPLLIAERGAPARWLASDLPYAAPELLGAEPRLDPSADLYALGAVLVEMLVGSPPPLARDADAADLRALEAIADPAVVAVARSALMRAPEDRYASSGELREDLERLHYDFSPIHARTAPRRGPTGGDGDGATVADHVDDQPNEPRRRSLAWAIAGVACLLAAAALAVSSWRHRAEPGPRAAAAPSVVAAAPAVTATTASAPVAARDDGAAPPAANPERALADHPSPPAAVVPGDAAVAAAAKPAVVPDPPPPRWASAGGIDATGRWCDIAIGAVRQRLRWCPPGSFWLGSPADEDGRHPDERRVLTTISRGFWLGDSEVAQELWRAVMNDDPSHFHGRSLPVDSLTWPRAEAFVAALGATLGARARLPTEAEWEYACRAGASANGPAVATPCWSVETSGGTTQPVRALAPNAWGLHDMRGNVMEWCADAYAPYPDREAIDPLGRDGTQRVARGGAWSMPPTDCRAAARFRYLPVFATFFIGMRVLIEDDGG